MKDFMKQKVPSESSIQWRLKNKEHLKKYYKEYYRKHLSIPGWKEKKLLQRIKYNKENPQVRILYRKNNRILLREKAKQYRLLHPRTKEQIDRQKSLYQKNKKNVLKVKKELRNKRKYYYIKLKGGCCAKCGYRKNISALEFHHNSGKKELNIGNYDNKKNIDCKELDKCILLCSNCHRETHFPHLTYKDN